MLGVRRNFPIKEVNVYTRRKLSELDKSDIVTLTVRALQLIHRHSPSVRC